MEKAYKILVFTDMHGNRRAVDIAKRMLEKEEFDMVVYLGDFSESLCDESVNCEDLAYLVNSLGQHAKIHALFGNCDSPALRELLEEQGISLHDKIMFKGKTAIVGWGGSHPTPFHTPSEMSESEIEKGLRRLFFTHEPPSKTKADKIESGHVGSEALRHIIEEYQPNVHICGHIHEAKCTDFLKDTKIINIGPSRDGHFLVLHIDGEISVKEISI